MKNFGLYNGETLFYTDGGSFAADAWIKSDGQNCGDVAGESFIAITADDGHQWNIGRRNVSPITEEKFAELFPKSHPAFRLIVELDKLEPFDLKAQLKWYEAKLLLHYLFEQGYTYNEVKQFCIDNYFSRQKV